MKISMLEYKNMIPNFESYFDDELEIWKRNNKVAQVYLGKWEKDNSLSVHLIRKLLKMLKELNIFSTTSTGGQQKLRREVVIIPVRNVPTKAKSLLCSIATRATW